MRILLVAPQPFYQERGTPIAVRLLAEALCGEGHAVDLLAYHEGSDVSIAGLRILRTPPVPGVRNIPIGISWQKLVCDLFLCWRLFFLALSRRYDVIHAVEEAVFPAVLLRTLVRTRVVYDMDSMLGDQLLDKWRFLRPVARGLNAIERAAIRRTDAVFAVCRDLAARVAADAPRVPVFLIEDVALPPSTPAGRVDDLRESFGIRGVMAMYVGNLEHYQGVETLVQAMTSVPCDLDIALILIGGVAVDVERVRGQVQQLGLQDRIILTGPRPLAHLAEYLAQADMLVSPRLVGNNTPMKIYSYMQSGKAILATRIRAHTQVLDEECAFLVEPTPQALAEGLRALSADPVLRARLGAAAQRRARQHYSLDAFREKVRVAYRSLDPAQVSG